MAQDLSLLQFAPKGGTAGPFSDILTSAYQQQPDQPVQNAPTKAGGLAFYGTKLLKGIQQGRAQAYLRSENERQQHFSIAQNALANAMQFADTPEAKAKLEQLNLSLLTGKLQEELNRDDTLAADGKSGKKKGSAKQDDSLHGKVKGVLQHVLNTIAPIPQGGTPDVNLKALAGAIDVISEGPGKEQRTNEAIGQMQSAAAKAKEAASKSGQPLFQEDIIGSKEYQDGLNKLSRYSPERAKEMHATIAGIYPQKPTPGSKESAALSLEQTLRKPPEARSAETESLGTPTSVGFVPPQARPQEPPPAQAHQPDAEHEQMIYDLAQMAGRATKTGQFKTPNGKHITAQYILAGDQTGWYDMSTRRKLPEGSEQVSITPPRPERLIRVKGPGGKEIYLPESEAKGKEVYHRPPASRSGQSVAEKKYLDAAKFHETLADLLDSSGNDFKKALDKASKDKKYAKFLPEIDKFLQPLINQQISGEMKDPAKRMAATIAAVKKLAQENSDKAETAGRDSAIQQKLDQIDDELDLLKDERPPESAPDTAEQYVEQNAP